MKVLITGIDGYLGWPLALYLAKRGHEIAGIDNHSRREWVKEVGSQSAIPIPTFAARERLFHENLNQYLQFYCYDLSDWNQTSHAYKTFEPEVVIYLGEMPSAAYSMTDIHHAVYTQRNNVIGTLVTLYAMYKFCPDAHLIKLGTMGEYGTPNCDIPEGFFPDGVDFIQTIPGETVVHRGKLDGKMFPRNAGSWYHQSKVHDSHNIEMACRFWGFRATDIMQGVVYGTQTDEMQGNPELATRFDFDECFGTVINRFCAQAVIGEPLTVYGGGYQKRGFIPLRDSMQCLGIALKNPPQPGEYRVFNQFEEVHTIYELAERVCRIGSEMGLDVEARRVDNPRVEKEAHYYKPENRKLFDLDYLPTQDIDRELRLMLGDLVPHADRIRECREVLQPTIQWK